MTDRPTFSDARYPDRTTLELTTVLVILASLVWAAISVMLGVWQVLGWARGMMPW